MGACRLKPQGPNPTSPLSLQPQALNLLRRMNPDVLEAQWNNKTDKSSLNSSSKQHNSNKDTNINSKNHGKKN